MKFKLSYLVLIPFAMTLAASMGSSAATQPNYVLSIVNYITAEDCLNTIPPGPTTRYMQDGQDLPAAGADLSGPICVGERVNFRLTPGKTYRVLRIVDGADVPGIGIYETKLIVDTQSKDPQSKFIIGCLSSQSQPSISEIKQTMRGIFKITP